MLGNSRTGSASGSSFLEGNSQCAPYWGKSLFFIHHQRQATLNRYPQTSQQGISNTETNTSERSEQNKTKPCKACTKFNRPKTQKLKETELSKNYKFVKLKSSEEQKKMALAFTHTPDIKMTLFLENTDALTHIKVRNSKVLDFVCFLDLFNTDHVFHIFLTVFCRTHRLMTEMCKEL